MSSLPRLRPLEILQVTDGNGRPSNLLRDPEGFSDDELLLSSAALFLAAHFDGDHSADQALDAFEKRFGSRPSPETLTELEQTLERSFFLETEAFEDRRRQLVDTFLEAPLRDPAHAGICYPKDPEEARLAVAGFFESAQRLSPDEEPPEHGLLGDLFNCKHTLSTSHTLYLLSNIFSGTWLHSN